jgi:protoporphyrinogen oxidase
MNKKKALIIGAGPAGLTAAYELLKRTDIIPIVLEKTDAMGGISRTISYKGNRIDIGGHRFFSKSDRVMRWWQEILPFQNQETNTPDPMHEDRVMLVRHRKSRIFFNRRLFDYPLKINASTIAKMGFMRTIKIGASYAKSVVFPLKNEQNLEQFFINRFGKELYATFFRSYTEKVWGVACNQISSEWGAQRIKGLSITKAVKHFLASCIPARKTDIIQKNIETSLIEQFLYPKYGPGQMWEEVAKRVTELGGIIHTNMIANKFFIENNKITKISALNTKTNTEQEFDADYVFSTMPIKDLIASFQTQVPTDIKLIGEGLVYRDFITVGILANKLSITEKNKHQLTDNWIYIQEADVLVGRMQIFNNWSPFMVADPNKIWIGLEYFCYEKDNLWKKTDHELIDLAKGELDKLGIVKSCDVLDATVIKVEKTYPAYFGTYNRFDILRNYLDTFENLFLIGRNGMHKYNNQDHSMLAAMTAVDSIIEKRTNKATIWAVNTENEYHESKM